MVAKLCNQLRFDSVIINCKLLYHVFHGSLQHNSGRAGLLTLAGSVSTSTAWYLGLMIILYDEMTVRRIQS